MDNQIANPDDVRIAQEAIRDARQALITAERSALIGRIFFFFRIDPQATMFVGAVVGGLLVGLAWFLNVKFQIPMVPTLIAMGLMLLAGWVWYIVRGGNDFVGSQAAKELFDRNVDLARALFSIAPSADQRSALGVIGDDINELSYADQDRVFTALERSLGSASADE